MSDGESFAARSPKRKDLSLQVSGISTEIFKQIETVENDHDASTAAALEAVERRGEMVVRVIEPRQMGRQASEAAKKFIAMQVRNRHNDSNDASRFAAAAARAG